ncbi:MAG: hypothetical protein ACPLPS_01990 [bacterium]
MYIWAMLFALLFAFGMCWVAQLNKDLITITLPPGNYQLQAYVWEIILASAAAALILAGIIALHKGSQRRRWERDIEAKIADMDKKLGGLAGKIEDLELKLVSSPPKVEEAEVSASPKEGG